LIRPITISAEDGDPRYMRNILTSLIALILATGPAVAGDGYSPPIYRAWVPEPEGRGCYWVRQRQFCALYCYTEIDGRRFCQEHARDAYPQAPVDEVVEWDPRASRPMKLGGPSRP